MESTKHTCCPAAAIAAASLSLKWATSSVASGIGFMQRAAVAAWARDYFWRWSTHKDMSRRMSFVPCMEHICLNTLRSQTPR